MKNVVDKAIDQFYKNLNSNRIVYTPHDIDLPSHEEDLDGNTIWISELILEDDVFKTVFADIISKLEDFLSYSEPRNYKGFKRLFNFCDDYTLEIMEYIFLVSHGKGLFTLNPIGVMYVQSKLSMSESELLDDQCNYSEFYQDCF